MFYLSSKLRFNSLLAVIVVCLLTPNLSQSEARNAKYRPTEFNRLKLAIIKLSDTESLYSSMDRWQRYSEKLLHSLAGDDLIAFSGVNPVVNIVFEHKPNAFAEYPNKLIISNELINLTTSRDEYAFVLAHELAHFVLKHHSHARTKMLSYSNPSEAFQTYLNDELAADRLALNIMKSSGFKQSAAVSILKKLADYRSGDTTPRLASIYPTLAIRIHKLEDQLSNGQRAFLQ
ncbi:MAG: hypothetical protein D6719_05515 [Candidatus Dadabacteria bacterium]|nr:MAG: hypothetical protein D6719_05515 [Candidatus Dadabacteria bacterium]